MDEWTRSELIRQVLALIPSVIGGAVAGIWTTGIVLITVKVARKRWHRDFLSRCNAEARSKIEACEAWIRSLEAELEQERALRQELGNRNRAATVMLTKAVEILATAPTSLRPRSGSGSRRS